MEAILSSLFVYLELRSEAPVAAQHPATMPNKALTGLTSVGDPRNLAAVRLDETNLRMESRQTVVDGSDMEGRWNKGMAPTANHG